MHAEAELLSLLALGEQVGTDDERRHTETCRECATELSELQRVTALGRSVGAETTMIAPSPTVWARIRDELGFDDSVEPPPVRSVDAPPPRTLSHPDRRRSPLAAIKAAIAGSFHGSPDHLRAHVRLTPVEASWSEASGTAELATDEQGRRLLQVALHADLPTSGVRQAWLIHRDDPARRQTLGILDGRHGLWTVDHSIDLEQYSILDISQQGTGQTEHSGHTIVRGELTLVS